MCRITTCGRIALGLSLCASMLVAAELSGRVTDERGIPLSLANVLVEGTTIGTSTDRDGRFRIGGLEAGELPLKVSHVGYESATRLLRIDGDTTIEVELSPGYVEAVPLTVAGGRVTQDHSSVTYSDISGDRLELSHSGQDLTQLLEGTPNLVTTSYGGTSIGYNEIRLRGFDQKRVEVLVNGIPLNDPEDHYVYWVDLPDMGQSLRDVQVQRGTGTGLFGGSNFGGSVNLLTGLSPGPGLELETARGSFNTRRHMIGGSSGLTDGGWQMDGRWSRILTDGFREGSAVDMWGYYLSVRRFREDGSLRVNHYNGRELTHVAWDGIEETLLYGLDGVAADRRANSYAVYPHSVDDFYQPHFELLADWALPDGSRQRLTLYHVIGSGFYETYKTGRDLRDYGYDYWTDYAPQEGDSGLYVEETVLETDLVNRRWIEKRQTGFILHNERRVRDLRLEVGAHGYTYDGEHFGEVIWADRLPPETFPGGRYYTHLSEKLKYGGYVSAERRLGERTALVATLAASFSRYDLRQLEEGNFAGANRHRFTDEHFFLNPSIGLSHRVSGGLILSAGASISHREPSRSEYWGAWEGPADLGVAPMFRRSAELSDGSLVWLDPLVDPERMLDVELGADLRGADHRLKVNLYWMDMRDEIINFGGVDEESPVRGNAPRSHHAGLEVDAEALLVNGLRAGLNLAYSVNRIDELTHHEIQYQEDWSETLVSRDFSGNEIAFSPGEVINFWFQWNPAECFRLRATAHYVGGQYLDNSGDDDFSALSSSLIDPACLAGNGGLRFDKRLDPYATLGLDASLRLQRWLKRDLSLKLHVENLLNAEYETGGYWNDWVDRNGDWLHEPQRALYPAAGRNWLLSLELRI